MRILVAIDDTDTMKVEGIEVRGTGKLANLIKDDIEAKGWGECKPVTRHQLLIHPDIPYTSHNSSMCFQADIAPSCLDELIAYASDFLGRESAPDADPGLCVVAVDRLSKPGWLISFGYMAKNYVLCKDDAYDLAQILGVHLSEHGGSGDGIIGALAATGLRLSGNDGRFQGKLKLNSATGIVSARDFYATGLVDQVKSLEEGIILDDNEQIILGDTIKAVLLEGKAVVPVYPVNPNNSSLPGWQTYSKTQLKDF